MAAPFQGARSPAGFPRLPNGRALETFRRPLAPIARLGDRQVSGRRWRAGRLDDALAGIDHGVLAHAVDVFVVRTGAGQALVEVELGEPYAHAGAGFAHQASRLAVF